MEPRLEALLDRVQAEASREEFPVDVAVYLSANKDPGRPILCAGSLDAAVCVVGRDLGKDEVRHGQPLIGAGGSIVRRGVLEAWGHPDMARGGRKELELALNYALLTNTVPYKPPGNKAYSEGIKERFRPFLAELLTQYWTGAHIITLGTEAFRWFEPFGESEAFEAIGRTDRRFETSFECQLPMPRDRSGSPTRKACRILPLPHPSPLNRRWTAAFPGMLARRLADIRAAVEGA